MFRAVDPLPSWDEIRRSLADRGIENVGVAPAHRLERARTELYRRRELGYSDTMQFTYRNPDRSTDPSRSVAGARSLIVAAMPYGSANYPDRPASTTSMANGSAVVHGRVARYAWIDYYEHLRSALRVVAGMLKASGERAVVFADDNSIVDREVAYRAGLGWFGKNANLLVQGGGSYFVLGSIITTAEYSPSEPVGDGCGACRQCLDHCPTGAIVTPGVIDARRCLAWLVQRSGPFPVEYRVALDDRFYGCDACQEACPPTVRFSRRSNDSVAASTVGFEPVDAWVEMVQVLNETDEALLARYGRWYVADRDPRWWRRNALIIIGNIGDPGDPAIRDLLRRYVTGDDELLAEHAEWALGRLAEREKHLGDGAHR